MRRTAQNRRQFMTRLGGSVLIPFLMPGCSSNRKGKPNIVMIVGDDIGFSDIGCYGAEIDTPNLDRLGDNGVRFSQFYNMAKCNPTRSSLLTGLYFGDARAQSLPQLLRNAGYSTWTSGKEHFDDWVPERCYAVNSFDRSFTFWATTEYFIPPSGRFQRPFHLDGVELEAGEIEREREPFHNTDVITDYALKWLDLAIEAQKPFLLYLPYHAAHYPLQARPEDIAKYRGMYKKGWDRIRAERFERLKELGLIERDCKLSPPEDNVNNFRGHPPGDEQRRALFARYRPWDSLTEKEQDELDLEMAVFAAMIDRMDQNIGRVLTRLEESAVLQDTLVLFFSDNGSCPYDSNVDFNIPPGGPDSYRCLSAAWANAGNTPFRFYKQYGHEGGCNTHFIAHWPRVIKKGLITHQPGHVVDILPTLLDIAGASYPKEFNGEPAPPLHGRSLLPVFQGRQRREPDFYISGFTGRFRMYRQGRWKIVRVNAGPWELYDMETDRTELEDLAEKKPAELARLVGAYRKRMKEMK